MNWVTGLVAVILFIGVFVGLYKGALKIAVSLFATVFTLAVVTFLTPYVAKAIMQYTPLDDMVREKVESAITDAVMEKAEEAEEDLLGDYQGLIPDEYEDSIADSVFDMEIPRDTQMMAIENADLPEVFKELLTENNNDETYTELGVSSFAQYAGAFLAKLIVNMIAFLGTFFVITVLLRAVLFGLDVIADLPVLGALNRLAGGAVGLVGALIVVWLLFLVMTLAYTTGPGRFAYESIQSNPILRMLYEVNPIMGLAVR